MGGETYSDVGVILGSGPVTLKITVGSFIPHEYVPNPYDTNYIFEGDYRSFAEDEATARQAAVVQVLNPAYSNNDFFSPPGYYTGQTVEYVVEYSGVWSVQDGHLTAEARADWDSGPPLKVAWRTAEPNGQGNSMFCVAVRLGPQGVTSRVKVECEGHTTNPLVPLGPEIDFRFTFELAFGENKVVYKVWGCHDEFPAIEAYLAGQPVYTQQNIAPTPLGVIGNCSYSFPLQSGVIQ